VCFKVAAADLDTALAGILDLTDTPGTSNIDPNAHGSGFDRVGAFQDGFGNGLDARLPGDRRGEAVATGARARAVRPGGVRGQVHRRLRAVLLRADNMSACPTTRSIYRP
jgi:hypothetical protein